MHRIQLAHDSRLPLAQLFARLSDHNQLSSVLGAPVRRIRDGKTETNGVGSVRQIGPALLGLEETVTASVPNQSIEYRITRGGFPLKNHLGQLAFSETAKGSRVEWTIEFDSALPLVGGLIRFTLNQGIGRGLRRLG
ncbi:MAG: SRPBCC family protein [Panacagrimonas sp.]